MIDLANPQTISEILKRHNFSTQKKFGQNFLINRSVLEASIKAAGILPTDIVVEIGAGIGSLTLELARHAQKVVVFEVDPSLRPVLKETLADCKNIELHFQDFRHTDLIGLLGQTQSLPLARPGSDTSAPIINTSSSTTNYKLQTINYKVVANLPYNAGTHIIGQLVQLSHPPQTITVLLQKEVAQKITATPPHATYLSNFIQTYGRPEIVQLVKPASFLPPPKVDSAILHISRHPSPVTSHSKIAISRFLHRGFASPRKKINKAFEVEDLQQANIDPNFRPENISFEQWVALYEVVKKEKGEEWDRL